MEAWQYALIANGVLAVAYVFLAWDMGRGLFRGGRWRDNPIGVTTFAIFLFCGIGHGVHAEHMIVADSTNDPSVMASREAHSNVWVWSWHALTAIVVAGYLVLRSRLRLLHSGSSLTRDLQRETAVAQRINMQVRDALRAADEHLNNGEPAAASRVLDDAILEAGALATELAVPKKIVPGVLRGQR